MPVDKFGGTNESQSSNTTSSSISYVELTSQLNNTFLRVDGANKATANLNLDYHRINNVDLPAADTDVTTKNYVDESIINFSDQLSDIMANISYASVAMRSTTAYSIPTTKSQYSIVLDTNITTPNPNNTSIVNVVNSSLVTAPPYIWFQIFKPGYYTLSVTVNVRNTSSSDITINIDIESSTGTILYSTNPYILQANSINVMQLTGTFNISSIPTTPGFILVGLFQRASSTGVNILSSVGTFVSSAINDSGTYLPLAGGRMIGDIDMNNKQINNVTDPTSNQQVATKNYVDSKSTNNFSNWSLSESVAAGQIRIYTDGQPYIANGTITANTAFTLGNSGTNNTWRAIKPTTSYQSITTSGGTTTLTPSNDIIAYLFGTSSHTVVFPSTSSLAIGARITVLNRSTVACTINDTFNQTIIDGGEFMSFVLVMSNSWFNLSLCNYRSGNIIQQDALTLSANAIAQNDSQSIINGKLQGQINAVIPQGALKTATSTIPAVTYSDIHLVTFPSGKTTLNGKIFILELWVERGSGEWFSSSCRVFHDNWPMFHKFTRNGTSLIIYFTAYPSGWTRNYRADYIELP